MDLRKRSPRLMISTGTLVLTLLMFTAAVHAESIKTVFVIAMENHNWTQPANDASAPLQIFQNPNAPYLNSLTNPASPNSAQVSFANAYTNVLATPSGNNPSIHPSEPNHIWMEGGTNLGVLNDNQPYGPGGTNQNTTKHFSTLLSQAGRTWKSYQEDIDTDAAGNVLPKSQWTSPITNRSGTYTTVPNPYNGSKQFDYAAKHMTTPPPIPPPGSMPPSSSS